MNYNFDIWGYLTLNAGLKTHLHDSKLFSFHTWRYLMWCPEKLMFSFLFTIKSKLTLKILGISPCQFWLFKIKTIVIENETLRLPLGII